LSLAWRVLLGRPTKLLLPKPGGSYIRVGAPVEIRYLGDPNRPQEIVISGPIERRRGKVSFLEEGQDG